MPDISIQVHGLEALQKKIGGLQTLKTVRLGLRSGALHTKGKADDYPPATIANSPGNPKRRWYERGYGPKWHTRAGIHGRKTSQTLGRKWTIGERDRGLTQVIGNNVSYGIYVQGEKQARFHQARGWKTTETIAREETDNVLGFVQQQVDKILSGR